jgi:hypothetical protein
MQVSLRETSFFFYTVFTFYLAENLHQRSGCINFVDATEVDA